MAAVLPEDIVQVAGHGAPITLSLSSSSSFFFSWAVDKTHGPDLPGGDPLGGPGTHGDKIFPVQLVHAEDSIKKKNTDTVTCSQAHHITNGSSHVTPYRSHMTNPQAITGKNNLSVT